MGTILEKIIAQKQEEISQLKAMTLPPKPSGKKRSLITQLKQKKELTIIAEFKRSSPSKPNINLAADPLVQTQIYERAGAHGLSVLTDTVFFQGSWDDLRLVRENTSLPILCKDFIVDPVQIEMAERLGADLILLIAAALDEDKLNYLYEYARERGLEVLMEVHNEKELERVLKTDNPLIGVNNRNLKTFEVDLTVTEILAPIIKKEGKFLISESGLKTKEDVLRVYEAGAHGILVGEWLMRSPNPAQVIQEIKLPLKQEISVVC